MALLPAESLEGEQQIAKDEKGSEDKRIINRAARAGGTAGAITGGTLGAVIGGSLGARKSAAAAAKRAVQAAILDSGLGYVGGYQSAKTQTKGRVSKRAGIE